MGSSPWFNLFKRVFEDGWVLVASDDRIGAAKRLEKYDSSNDVVIYYPPAYLSDGRQLDREGFLNYSFIEVEELAAVESALEGLAPFIKDLGGPLQSGWHFPDDGLISFAREYHAGPEKFLLKIFLDEGCQPRMEFAGRLISLEEAADWIRQYEEDPDRVVSELTALEGMICQIAKEG